MGSGASVRVLFRASAFSSRHRARVDALQASFRKAQAVPALTRLVGLGPGNATATAAARALLVLAYDYEKLEHWL